MAFESFRSRGRTCPSRLDVVKTVVRVTYVHLWAGVTYGKTLDGGFARFRSRLAHLSS